VQKSLSYTQDIFFGQRVIVASAKKNIWIDELRKELMESLK
jgi:hypothetical protein